MSVQSPVIVLYEIIYWEFEFLLNFLVSMKIFGFPQEILQVTGQNKELLKVYEENVLQKIRGPDEENGVKRIHFNEAVAEAQQPNVVEIQTGTANRSVEVKRVPKGATREGGMREDVRELLGTRVTEYRHFQAVPEGGQEAVACQRKNCVYIRAFRGILSAQLSIIPCAVLLLLSVILLFHHFLCVFVLRFISYDSSCRKFPCLVSTILIRALVPDLPPSLCKTDAIPRDFPFHCRLIAHEFLILIFFKRGKILYVPSEEPVCLLVCGIKKPAYNSGIHIPIVEPLSVLLRRAPSNCPLNATARWV